MCRILTVPRLQFNGWVMLSKFTLHRYLSFPSFLPLSPPLILRELSKEEYSTLAQMTNRLEVKIKMLVKVISIPTKRSKV